jgi:hypothetical protein
MSLQRTLDLLRLVLECKALGMYMGKYQVAAREYIYIYIYMYR